MCHIRHDLLEELRTGLEHDQVSSSDLIDNKTGSEMTQLYDYLEGANHGGYVLTSYLKNYFVYNANKQFIFSFSLLIDIDINEKQQKQVTEQDLSNDKDSKSVLSKKSVPSYITECSSMIVHFCRCSPWI